jgi:hypothetical protein
MAGPVLAENEKRRDQLAEAENCGQTTNLLRSAKLLFNSTMRRNADIRSDFSTA